MQKENEDVHYTCKVQTNSLIDRIVDAGIKRELAASSISTGNQAGTPHTAQINTNESVLRLIPGDSEFRSCVTRQEARRIGINLDSLGTMLSLFSLDLEMITSRISKVISSGTIQIIGTMYSKKGNITVALLQTDAIWKSLQWALGFETHDNLKVTGLIVWNMLARISCSARLVYFLKRLVTFAAGNHESPERWTMLNLS